VRRSTRIIIFVALFASVAGAESEPFEKDLILSARTACML
jgi:hypothetical protein